ncbi:hypothetical protein COMA1_40078 [Candidatus Nitrospira nitrosa]|uniref:Uncharacterized protein n=1 Tax=Candidatus Nitrospira nitrosa TaxID=1742972 RepID=A0A0S4LIU9_9BACT|nr:hypothetical protein COMA1_40078 [Candidatus Nitrospira nitrosa]
MTKKESCQTGLEAPYSPAFGNFRHRDSRLKLVKDATTRHHSGKNQVLLSSDSLYNKGPT